MLSDKVGNREVDVDSLPHNVRAAIADLTAKNPSTPIAVDRTGVLYRIRMSAPTNLSLDVLSVA
jgi:hypothetical protein